MKYTEDERPTGFNLVLKKIKEAEYALSSYGRFWYRHTYYLCNFKEPLTRFARHLPLSKAIQIRNLLRAFDGLVPVSRREVFNKSAQYLCKVPVYNGRTINSKYWPNAYAGRQLNEENDTTKLVIFRDIGMIVLMGGRMDPAKGVLDPTHALKLCHVYFPAKDKFFTSNSVEVCAYHHIYENYDLFRYGCHTAQQILIDRFTNACSAPQEYEEFPADHRSITNHEGLIGPVYGQALMSHHDPSWYTYLGKLLLRQLKRSNSMDEPWTHQEDEYEHQ